MKGIVRLKFATPDEGGGGASPNSGEIVRTATICNMRGLHARAAAKFVKLAGQFDAKLMVCHRGMEVSGLSIMGLMMLAAGPGTEITIRGSGADASRAVDAVVALILGKFEEE